MVSRFRFVAWLGVALVVFAAAACSSDPEVSSGSSDPANAEGPGTTMAVPGSMPADSAPALVTTDTLADQTFESTSVTGHDLVAGSTLSMSFTADQISANAGCNTMNGGYSLDGTTLVVSGLASTMMACDEALMAQDTWFGGFLEASPAIAATEAGISLTGDGVVVELASQAPSGEATLVGPTWTLETIESGETASNVPAGVEAPTLVFADDGTVAVFTGCNRGSTSAVVGDDGFITFEPVMTTMMSCGPEADGVAATVTTLLDGRVAFAWTDGDRLALSKDGQSLIFTAT